MLYEIGLTIAYDYDSPAIAGRHILRLMPAELPGAQRRITGLLTIAPEPPSAATSPTSSATARSGWPSAPPTTRS